MSELEHNAATTGGDEINIETIMQEIRQKILAETGTAGPRQGALNIPLSGKRLPSDFYDHLYYAGLAINDMHVRLQVTRSPLPIIGPLVDRLRTALHRLVLFYVHQAVERQAEVNRHLLQAISAMSAALEQEAEAPGNGGQPEES